MFEECRNEIENAKKNVVEIGLLEKNAENYIYKYFENIKRQIEAIFSVSRNEKNNQVIAQDSFSIHLKNNPIAECVSDPLR